MYEPMPLPGAYTTAACGRMSFRGANTVIEELSQQRMGAPKAAKPTPLPEPGRPDVTVSDQAMAAMFKKPADYKWVAPTQIKVYGEEPSGPTRGSTAPASVPAAKKVDKQKKAPKQEAAPAENSFAPLRPIKKPKTA